MITSIEIEGLRGIQQGKIEGLAPLTLIVGPNGSGKTAVLEALGLLCAGPNALTVWEALTSREWLGLEGMKHWFRPEGAEVRGIMVPDLRSSHIVEKVPMCHTRVYLGVDHVLGIALHE